MESFEIIELILFGFTLLIYVPYLLFLYTYIRDFHKVLISKNYDIILKQILFSIIALAITYNMHLYIMSNNHNSAKTIFYILIWFFSFLGLFYASYEFQKENQ